MGPALMLFLLSFQYTLFHLAPPSAPPLHPLCTHLVAPADYSASRRSPAQTVPPPCAAGIQTPAIGAVVKETKETTETTEKKKMMTTMTNKKCGDSTPLATETNEPGGGGRSNEHMDSALAVAVATLPPPSTAPSTSAAPSATSAPTARSSCRRTSSTSSAT